MILAFHPTRPEIPGEARPVPADWLHYLSPWSKAIFRQSDFGKTLIQELRTEDFGIYSWRLEINKAIRLYPLAEMPTIALQFTIDGNIPCKLNGFGDKLLEMGSQEMFYVPIGFNEAWFEPGAYESLHIELKPHYLEELIEIRPEIKELVVRLQSLSSSGLPMAAAPSNYVTGSILQNLKNCNKTGPLLKLEMHKYILELHSEHLTAIQQKEEDGKRTDIPHRELMVKIRNHILYAPNVHEHTLEKLCRYFGTSQTLLKMEFKTLCGVSVADFVRARVFDRARFLLSTTKKTVEEIAVEVGYSGREALERSFKKEFGYSPSNLRLDLNG